MVLVRKGPGGCKFCVFLRQSLLFSYPSFSSEGIREVFQGEGWNTFEDWRRQAFSCNEQIAAGGRQKGRLNKSSSSIINTPLLNEFLPSCYCHWDSFVPSTSHPPPMTDILFSFLTFETIENSVVYSKFPLESVVFLLSTFLVLLDFNLLASLILVISRCKVNR